VLDVDEWWVTYQTNQLIMHVPSLLQTMGREHTAIHASRFSLSLGAQNDESRHHSSLLQSFFLYALAYDISYTEV
jgi:hypothetical protein